MSTPSRRTVAPFVARDSQGKASSPCHHNLFPAFRTMSARPGEALPGRAFHRGSASARRTLPFAAAAALFGRWFIGARDGGRAFFFYAAALACVVRGARLLPLGAVVAGTASLPACHVPSSDVRAIGVFWVSFLRAEQLQTPLSDVLPWLSRC